MQNRGGLSVLPLGNGLGQECALLEEAGNRAKISANAEGGAWDMGVHSLFLYRALINANRFWKSTVFWHI